MKKMKLFTKILLCVTLVLVILVSGLTYPGFMLPLFSPHVKNTISSDAKKKVKEKNVAKGNSKAFKMEACDGFTISAEKNALDKNRTFTVEDVDDQKEEELQAVLDTTDYGYMLIRAWEVDAGLADDEFFPGQYQMDFNLKELGIPEDLWEGVRFIRVDDSGKIYEYCSTLNGDTVTVMSRQNSIIECVIAFGLLLGPGIDISLAAQSGVTVSTGTTYIPIKDETGKHVYDLKVTRDQFILSICEKMKLLEEPMRQKAYARAMKEMKGKYGDDWYNPIHEAERTEAELEYAKAIAKNNQDYLRLKQDLEQNLKGVLEGEELEAITRGKEYLIMARKYIKDELGVQVTEYVMTVEFSTNLTKAAGVTVSPVIGHPYCVFAIQRVAGMGDEANLAIAYDEFLLTIVHELFHASQRTYKYETLQCYKFDEMLAQVVEEDAYHYFSEKYTGKYKITTTTGHLKNLKNYCYYKAPLDDYSISFADGKSFQCKGDTKADVSYAFASFLRYVWKKRKPELTYTELMKKYEGYSNADVSEMMRGMFGVSEEQLTVDYLEFMKKNKKTFYEYVQTMDTVDDKDPLKGDRVFVPMLFMYPDRDNHVDMMNTNYTTRIRKIYGGYGSENDDLTRILIVQDENFKEVLPDVRLYPVGETPVKNCKYGAITDMVKQEDMDLWIMEADGGSGEAGGWFADKSGYSAYSLRAPQIENGEIEDGLYKFTLPEKSKAAQDGYIDGYRVTIKCTDGTETVRYYRIDGAGEEIGIKLSKLTKKSVKGDPELAKKTLGFTLSMCEYIKEPNGRKIYGPDSGGARTMEEEMEDMLAEMGALSGDITISLGWHSKDDLDLHCYTPDGGHIYYRNKTAGGGTLDIDMNAKKSKISMKAVENIYFENPAPGEYRIQVVNYEDRTEKSDTKAVVKVTIGDQSYLYRPTLGPGADIVTFTYGGKEEEEIGGEYLDNTPVTTPPADTPQTDGTNVEDAAVIGGEEGTKEEQ